MKRDEDKYAKMTLAEELAVRWGLRIRRCQCGRLLDMQGDAAILDHINKIIDLETGNNGLEQGTVRES